MADGTKIEWSDATANVVNGCSVLSPGCTNCYAMRLAGTRMKHHPTREGLTQDSKAGPVWTGEVRFHEPALQQVLRWKRGRQIFWNAHGDLFHESVPDEWIDRCFAAMALTPQHQHQVLTKRSARMREYLTEKSAAHRQRPYDLDSHLGGQGDELDRDHGASKIDMAEWPLPNVWLGVSVEDQQRADERIPDLLATPAAVRWISAEPLLGPLDVQKWLWKIDDDGQGIPTDEQLSWVVVGGESGPGARPMHPDWARSLRDQCAEAGVPFLHKQNGEYAPGEIAGEFLNPAKPAKGLSYFDGRWDECWSEPDGHCDDEPDVYRIGKARAGRLLDGVQHDGYPA